MTFIIPANPGIINIVLGGRGGYYPISNRKSANAPCLLAKIVFTYVCVGFDEVNFDLKGQYKRGNL